MLQTQIPVPLVLNFSVISTAWTEVSTGHEDSHIHNPTAQEHSSGMHTLSLSTTHTHTHT
jgi:hypothetical protein